MYYIDSFINLKPVALDKEELEIRQMIQEFDEDVIIPGDGIGGYIF